MSQQCVRQESSVSGVGKCSTLPGLEAAAGVSWKLKGWTDPALTCHVLIFPGKKKPLTHTSAHPSPDPYLVDLFPRP